MEQHNKAFYVFARKVTEQHLTSHTLNASAREMHEQYTIGRIVKNRIEFNRQDRARLRDICQRQLGKPLSEVDFTGDRMHMAAQVANEKWASSGVFDHLINMAGFCPLPLCHTGTQSPQTTHDHYTLPGCVYSAPRSVIAPERIASVVVVENGVTMTTWADTLAALPSPFDKGNTLIIFKGKGQNQNEVIHLLQALPSEVLVGVFFDFDIAGLCMALRVTQSLTNAKLVLPVEAEIITLSSLTKTDVYEQQLSLMSGLEDQLQDYSTLNDCAAAHIRKYITGITHNQLAVTQESMVAKQIKLCAVPLHSR